MSNRLTAKPSVSSPSPGDVIFLDGATGVRALDAGYPAAVTAAAVAGHDASADAHGRMVCVTQSIVESKTTAATGTAFSSGATMTALRTNEGAGTCAVSLPWIPLSKDAYPYITRLNRDFELSLWVSRTTVNASDVLRFGYGKTTAAAVGEWAGKGFGFSIYAGALKGFTHDGTTLEVVSLVADVANSQHYYTLRVRGGVVSWVVDGVSLGTSARVLSGTTNDGIFRVELEATAGTSRYDFANHLIRFAL